MNPMAKTITDWHFTKNTNYLFSPSGCAYDNFVVYIAFTF